MDYIISMSFLALLFVFIFFGAHFANKLKQNSRLSDLKFEIEILKEKLKIIEGRQKESTH